MDELFMQHGVPEGMRRIVKRVYETFSEAAEEDDARIWVLSADDYYDLLESLTIGHRRIKAWVREKRAGAAVTLTSAGAALFNALDADARDKYAALKALTTLPDTDKP